MPSILSEFSSEPVKMVSSDVSPYEPPERFSQEKPSRKSSANIGTVVNGYTIDSLGVSKRIDGMVLNGPKGLSQSLQSLPNGRSSESTDGKDKSHSRNGSSFSLTRDVNGATDGGRHSPTPSYKRIKVGYPERTQNLLYANGNKPPSRPRSPEHLQKSAGNKSHSRAHSASAPSAPTPDGMVTNEKRSYVPERDDKNSSSKSKPNRSSAPTTKQNATAAASSGTSIHSNAPRLQHRHTLQIPRLSTTSRTSKEITQTPTAGSEVGTLEHDRLSPMHGGAARASLSMGRRPTRSIHSDMYLDEIPQDVDVDRWTETIRQKRASRKQRKEEEDDERVVIGNKVDMNHVNWMTAYNMLTGIRFTVSRTNAKIDRELTNADFDAKHKFSFDITGNELTPSAKYDFKFKDYAPWVFRHLRAKFKLDPADYLMSLTSKYILSELGSPGKSGSFFYFSRDYKYIIKTIHHAEHKLLRKVLRQYYSHVVHNPNTLISQFYGLHRVKVPGFGGRKIHFVIMNNLFPPHRDIHQTFDLKGSTIGRDFREDDLEENPRATLKDLNWIRRNKHFEFGERKKALFIGQLKKDVELLKELKIMDYSLLVGIHDLGKGNEENLREKTLQVFQPGGEHEEEPQPNMLTRSPSKLDNARKAKQLREIIKREKPVPIEQSTSKMPDEILEERKDFIFYRDDGGFRATHDNDEPGEEIYYLGIIDCLTHYGFVKRAEHVWKGMSSDKTQISPIPPRPYGERFVKFITGLTKTREEAERSEMQDLRYSEASGGISRQSTDKILEKAEKQARKSFDKSGAAASSEALRDRTLTTTQSPSSAEANGTATGNATLPIVEEDAEGTSREASLRRNSRSPAPPSPLHEQQREMGIPEDPDGGTTQHLSSSSPLGANAKGVDVSQLPSVPLMSPLRFSGTPMGFPEPSAS